MEWYNEALIYLYKLAKEQSLDPSTQNAAAIVNEDKDYPFNVLCYGINGLTSGIENVPAHWQKPLKNKLVEHAERSVILGAARRGIKTEGMTMVCCWAACSDCSRAIQISGIRHLITHKIAGNVHPEWEEEIKVGFDILNKGGVKITVIEDKLDATNSLSVLRRGELVYP